MKFGGWRQAAAALMFCGIANAGSLLYTFGADGGGAPTSLNQMDPASAASVTNVQTPVGDGNTGFNGGLVGVAGLLYGIGNDSFGNATLFSFSNTGQNLTPVSSDFNVVGDAAGVGFLNGLGEHGGVFYAIGDTGAGEDLFQIGNGVATDLQPLNTFGGTYKGLAWDNAIGGFYAIIADASSRDNSGDLLVRFTLGGPVGVVAHLTTLDQAVVGTHLGGIADTQGGILYDIYTDPGTLTGQLEQLTVGNGPVSAVTLYDTNIPLAENAGIAIIPEPGTLGLVGLALIFASQLSRKKRR